MRVFPVFCVAAVAAALVPAGPSAQAPRTLRLHGTVEPVHSYTIAAPRLSAAAPGSPPSPLLLIRIVPGGTFVTKGDLLVEFDRQAQLNAARNREADYADALEQIKKKRGETLAARAMRDAQLAQAANGVRIAELDVAGNDMVAPIVAERNVQALEKARARIAQLQKTSGLRDRADRAALRILEIQRDRALNAWQHAKGNAERMRITAPIDGLVVLKSIWKGGAMAEVQEGEEVRPGIPILDVVDPSAMRVRAHVNQADIVHLSVGQPVRITLDSYAGRQFGGRLEHLSPIAIPSALSNRVRRFVAVFTVNESDEHLLPDLAAAIDLVPLGDRLPAAQDR